VRSFGGAVLILGVIGFLYCSSQLSQTAALPADLGVAESLRHAAGRWEVGRYASAIAALFGFLMAMFPRGR
jgi:hypothetical protein